MVNALEFVPPPRVLVTGRCIWRGRVNYFTCGAERHDYVCGKDIGALEIPL
jgi:hypothetical protein